MRLAPKVQPVQQDGARVCGLVTPEQLVEQRGALAEQELAVGVLAGDH